LRDGASEIPTTKAKCFHPQILDETIGPAFQFLGRERTDTKTFNPPVGEPSAKVPPLLPWMEKGRQRTTSCTVRAE
jgi:hypothetical protein